MYDLGYELGQSFVSYYIAILLFIIPIWVIFRKSGFNPLLSLIAFIPLFGMFIILLILAFREWPNVELFSKKTNDDFNGIRENID